MGEGPLPHRCSQGRVGGLPALEPSGDTPVIGMPSPRIINCVPLRSPALEIAAGRSSAQTAGSRRLKKASAAR